MSRAPESRPRPDAGAPPAVATLHDPGRRRLFRGAAGGGAVLLATQARTALGQTACESPSANFSGNASPAQAPLPCTGGRSPGFWKQPQHFGYWGSVVPATTRKALVPCSSGLKNVNISDITVHGTTLWDLGFSNAPSSSKADRNGTIHPPGVWAVLVFPEKYPGGQLMRHLAAAWLNAGYYGDYPISKPEILKMWRDTAAGGAYCPASMPSCTGWTADEVCYYIAGLWDNYGADDSNLCKDDAG